MKTKSKPAPKARKLRGYFVDVTVRVSLFARDKSAAMRAAETAVDRCMMNGNLEMFIQSSRIHLETDE